MVWVHETQANARQGGQEGREAAMVKQYAAMTREMHTWKGLTIFPYRFLVPFSSPRPRQRCNLEASVRGLPCELGFPKSRWLAVGEPLAAHCPYPTGPAACAMLHPARTMPARTRRHRYAMLALRCVCSQPCRRLGSADENHPDARLSFFGSFANLHAHVMLAAPSSHSRHAANSGPFCCP